jgi:HSF-type DNA-binding
MANIMVKHIRGKELSPTLSSKERQDKGKDKLISGDALSMSGITDSGNNGAKDTHDRNSVLRPYPYFYYQDYSTIPDPDPTIPLTSIGKVPSFLAKMHSILSRTDFQDVISWMPHGRAWRVHKPKEFESRVIPLYFEHVKYSSFVRQANGWGFHRITVDSSDRNAYYHPMFLRGLPHLCKNMKRPGISKKLTLSPENEPNLYEISRLFPVPDKVVDDSALLTYTTKSIPVSHIPILKINSTFSNQLLKPVEPIPAICEHHQDPIIANSVISDPKYISHSFQLNVGARNLF